MGKIMKSEKQNLFYDSVYFELILACFIFSILLFTLVGLY